MESNKKRGTGAPDQAHTFNWTGVEELRAAVVANSSDFTPEDVENFDYLQDASQEPSFGVHIKVALGLVYTLLSK